jgi:hypothetical protein
VTIDWLSPDMDWRARGEAEADAVDGVFLRRRRKRSKPRRFSLLVDSLSFTTIGLRRIVLCMDEVSE